MSRLTFLLLLSLMPVWACDPPRIEDYAPGSQPASSSGSPQEEALLLAEVNGEPITLADFQRQLRNLSDAAQSRLSGDQGRRRFLEALITARVLSDAARRDGWSSDPAVQWAEEQALLDVVRERLVRSQDREASIGQSELTAYYEINAFRFERPESRWIAVLVLEEEERAHQVAGRYRSRYVTDVAASLALFDELTTTERTGRTQPGDLGFVTRTDLEAVAGEAFVEAVMALRNTGELVGPVAVAGGWALVQLRELREAIERPFDSVVAEIHEQILQDRRARLTRQLTDGWRREARIEIDRNLLDEVERAWTARGHVDGPALWESELGFVLDERLTPVGDLTMLGGLLGPAPEPETDLGPPASPSNDGAEGE